MHGIGYQIVLNSNLETCANFECFKLIYQAYGKFCISTLKFVLNYSSKIIPKTSRRFGVNSSLNE